MSKPHTMYQWKVTADDQHGHVVERLYQFTTGDVLRQKWSVTTGPAGGLYAADIDGDGAMEIMAASPGKVFALRGTDGSQKWAHYESNIDYATVLIEDLDNDGLPEVLGQHYHHRRPKVACSPCTVTALYTGAIKTCPVTRRGRILSPSISTETDIRQFTGLEMISVKGQRVYAPYPPKAT